jgi:exosortase
LAVGGAIFFAPIRQLANLSFHSELYSHFILIPVVSIFFLFVERKNIFADTDYSLKCGLVLCALALVVFAIATGFRENLVGVTIRDKPTENDYLTLCMVGAVAWIIGSFIAAYGAAAFKKARFPLLFLVFTIPVPLFLLHPVVKALQYASAEAANLVFKLTGVPYLRDGLIFEFTGITIKVAEVCSGIRSSLALFILSIITGHMFLKRMSHKIILSLLVFPITVVKNALRIATISLLANYVDISFLTHHWIHRSGGIPFFIVALCFFIPCVWLLRRTEMKKVVTS